MEITRSRKGQLGRTGDKSRSSAAADANLLARRAESGGEDFLLAVAADGVPADKVQSIPFVSQKGASRTAEQLRSLLSKPGREDLLEMYSDDIAEFSIPVGLSAGEEEALEPRFVSWLGLHV